MIITITGLPGTNTRKISKLLALHLGVRYMAEEEILKMLALSEGIQKEKLAEKMFEEKTAEKMKQLVLKEAKGDHVIIDFSLATWLLSEAELKVFIQSPEKSRALELTKEKKIPMVVARKELEEKEEEERKAFLHSLGINIYDLKSFDLVLNSSKLNEEGLVAVVTKYLKGMSG